MKSLEILPKQTSTVVTEIIVIVAFSGLPEWQDAEIEVTVHSDDEALIESTARLIAATTYPDAHYQGWERKGPVSDIDEFDEF